MLRVPMATHNKELLEKTAGSLLCYPNTAKNGASGRLGAMGSGWLLLLGSPVTALCLRPFCNPAARFN